MLLRLGRWRLDPRHLLLRNVPWKLTAVLIALVASGVAARTVDETTQAFPGRIAVERANVPEGHILRGSLGEVEVSVRGPAEALGLLGAASFRARVDLAEYDLARVGEPQDLPIRVSVSEAEVRVVDVRPSTVIVRVVPVGTKRLPVQVRFENEPPAGYQAAPATVSPVEVELRGPADALGEVASVVATVRFLEAPTDLALSPRAVPVDGAGREVLEIEVEPRNVDVAVALAETQPTRTVAIVPVLRGTVARGYWVAGVAVNPPVATIRGDAAALALIDRVETVAVDVGGALSDREARPLLILPEGTSLARPVEVVVTVSVRVASGSRPFPTIAVQAEGVPPDMVAEISPSTISVTLAGPMPSLEAVEPQQILASVDVGDRGPGTYELPVQVVLPPGVRVLSATPSQVTVVVRSR